MFTADDIRALTRDLESDRVERKRRLSDPDAVREAICAFANDLPGHRRPGYVLLGVDGDGAPSRLPITDELLRKLADMRSDGNILPLPTMTVARVEIEPGVHVAVVEVLPADAPPVRLRGRVHVRVGPRRAVATVEEERRLIAQATWIRGRRAPMGAADAARSSGGKWIQVSGAVIEKQVAGVRTFDERPCLGATLDDLDLDLFRRDYLPRAVAPEVLAENRRTVEDQLASLRFLDPATELPTHAGVLVLGRDPFKVTHGAFVQFVRFEGMDRAAPIRAQRRLAGSLVAQLRDLDRLLEIWIQVALVIPTGTIERVESPDYPLVALREVIVNALVHRAYDVGHAPATVYWFHDRVEVASPGGLYGRVTPENFGRQIDYRNPTLAEAAKALGYVERFGTGIQRIRSALSANGNPEPTFQFEPGAVTVTLRPRPDPFLAASQPRIPYGVGG